MNDATLRDMLGFPKEKALTVNFLELMAGDVERFHRAVEASLAIFPKQAEEQTFRAEAISRMKELDFRQLEDLKD
ncbi:MAG: hypothetical protein EOP04_06700, partial [Proteobacteria bacterium]